MPAASVADESLIRGAPTDAFGPIAEAINSVRAAKGVIASDTNHLIRAMPEISVIPAESAEREVPAVQSPRSAMATITVAPPHPLA